MYKQYKQSKSKDNSVTAGRNSMTFWVLAVFSMLFLFWAPYQKALFNGRTVEFERPLYSALVWSFLILFCLALYIIPRWKVIELQSLYSLAIWIFPLTFVLSKINQASSFYATNMVYIQLIYVVFFLAGIYIAKNNLGNLILQNGFMLSGYSVVIFGLLNWYGYQQAAGRLVSWFTELVPGQMIYQDAVMLAGEDLRLTSTFQYANSYAAYLIILLFSGVYLTVTSTRWYSKLLHGFMLVPILISFMLTLSRGALVLLPIIFLIIMLFTTITRQLFMLVYLALSGVACMLLLGKATLVGDQIYKQSNNSSASAAFWLLISVSVIVAAILWIIQRFVYPRADQYLESIQFRGKVLVLPVVAIVLGLIGAFILFGNSGILNLFPEDIRNRIENINLAQHSVLERGTFYKDSMKLFKDYPLLGAGGGGWAALYEKYQNNPYTSREAHNYFLQYLVESGLLGLGLLIAMIVSILYMFLKSRFRNRKDTDRKLIYFIVTISLLIHSMLDFDMSYIYLGVLLFLSLGSMISGVEKSYNIQIKPESFSNKVFPIALIAVALVFFFVSTRFLSANTLYRVAFANAQKGGTIDAVMQPLNKALDARKNHPDYNALKIDLLFQIYSQTKNESYYDQALQIINQLKQSEPYNRLLLEKEIYAYTAKDQLPKALEIVNANITNFPWDISLYEKSISFQVDLGDKSRVNKDEASKNKYWDGALALYKEVVNRTSLLAELPKEQRQGRAFGVTKTIALPIAQTEYIRGQYNSAEALLKPVIAAQLGDPTDRQVARWYLASIQKQNKNDQDLYNKLIAADSKEQQEVQNLVNATF